MTSSQAYEILREIVSSHFARGEKVRLLPETIAPGSTLEELGIDLMAFSEILEDLTNRFGGKDFHLDTFLVPEEYFYLTFDKLLDSVTNGLRSPIKNPIVVYVDDEEENIFIFKRKFG